VPGEGALKQWELEFAEGSEEAFNKLYELHWSSVKRAAFANNGPCSTADAEDIALAAFIRAWQRRGEFDPDRGSFQAWVRGIAGYIKLSFVRTEKRYVLGLGENGELADPGNQFSAVIDRQHISQLLQCLPLCLRETVDLVWLQEYSYQEAANKLGIPVSTVGTRLYEAKRKLKLAALGAKDNYREIR
jgi:RNA polymerase sigma-70 factor (ECF subfamily)